MFTSDTLLDFYHQATNGIFAVLVGVVALSLVVGGIVIMNIMLMVVSERTREIGLRKALGAKRRDIMSQVLTESVTLSTFGGLVGIALGFLAAHGDRRASRRCRPSSNSGPSFWASASPRASDCSSAPTRPRVPRGSTRSRRCVVNKGLIGEVWRMALDTLRGNKLRSALTVLGVVIGITSIVGMTSLIRGFDESLRDMIRALGPNTIFVAKFSAVSLTSGADFADSDAPTQPDHCRCEGDREAGAVRRDRRRLARAADRAELAGAHLLPQRTHAASSPSSAPPRSSATSTSCRLSSAASSPRRGRAPAARRGARLQPVRGAVSTAGPRSDRQEGAHRRHRVHGRRRAEEAAARSIGDQDDFVVIPQTTHQVIFGGSPTIAAFGGSFGNDRRSCRYKDAPRDQAMAEVEEIMRIRHGLKLDEAERLRHRHAGRDPEDLGSHQPAASSSRWSSFPRSR